MNNRLTLTWFNKDRSVVADAEGGYLWVDSTDPRAAEIRLLEPVTEVGETDSPNMLIRGDSLHALRVLAKSPAYLKKFAGKVKLVYIDPPFNTNLAFEHYDDAMEHSVWLGMMRERLELIRDLLAPDGSVWVHLDDSEMAYAKVLMDEIFGRKNFIATVVWQKRYSRDNRLAIGAVHDYILVYAPLGNQWKHVRNKQERIGAKEYRNPNNDPRGAWRPIPMDVQAGHATASQFYEVTTPGGATHKPSRGRAWSLTADKMQELADQGLVYFGKDGKGKPNLIRYLADDDGLAPWSWWTHEEVGHTDESKKEILALFPGENPFDTPKPERLLQRIIHIASDPGDTVLDVFAGSGTTAAVAHKMGRRWVTAELSEKNVDQFVRPRLEMVVEGNDPGGITEAVEWKGGGGFRELRVCGPVYSPIEIGGVPLIMVADDTDDKTLAASVAAQLGYNPDSEARSPFVGRKGRSRLAVLRGAADEASASAILSGLDEGESVLIAATSVDPAAAALLKVHSRGSRVVRIPSGLFEKSKVIR